ncbi:MAG: synthase family protein [Chromatiaceae bacterium]|nr:synthase family protein [Chromatiaceae bacterium]
MRIQCLKHVTFEGPAGIADWAEARGHTITLTPLYEGVPVPDLDAFDWLVVMGGPMGVGDESVHPWLAPEKALIGRAIAAAKTVLGVCLGAQLIAEALGARVYPNPEKEIGWMPVELTESGRDSPLTGFLPASLDVFHWHGDTFDLPPGAVRLARSGPCANQAFVYDGRVLGLQFHLESTPASVADILAHCAQDIVPAPYVQTAERMLAATPEDYARINGALFGILDRLAGGAE